MTLKKFCFNKGIFRKNLQRFWLLPLSFFVILYFSVIRPASNAMVYEEYFNIWINTSSKMLFFVIAYSLLAACCVFSYLYNNKSSYMLHALPVTRKSLFLTNYVSGFVMVTVPIVLTCLAVLGVEMMHNSVDLPLLLRYFALLMLQVFFFYSFAVFCAMLTGNLVVLPILYVILNFTVIVLEFMLRSIASLLIVGSPGVVDSPSLTAFSPIVYIIEHFCHYASELGANMMGEGWGYFFMLAAVALIFIVLSMLLYKKRLLECAGEVIVHPFLKAVFKYTFTFGCAIVLGMSLTAFMGFIVPNLLIGAFIGYFTAEMLLKKSLKIFKSSYKGFLVTALIILLIDGICFFDVFGVAKKIPSVPDIKSVSVDAIIDDHGFISFKYDVSDNAIDNAQDIALAEQICALHAVLLDEQYARISMDSDNTVRLYFDYTLKNSKSISRLYVCSLDELLLTDSHDFADQLVFIANSSAMIAERNSHFLDIKSDEITSLLVNNKEVLGTNRSVLLNALQQDLREGNIGRFYFQNTAQYDAEMTDVGIKINCSTMPEYNANISVLNCSEHTIAVLRQLGLWKNQI